MVTIGGARDHDAGAGYRACGDRRRAWRYGLTQKDIATSAHVSERTVYAWKRDHGGVRDRNYDRLAALREVVLIVRDSLTERGVGQWLRARNRLLDGRRPTEVLAAGGVDAVRGAAVVFVEAIYV
jgi:transcriptional regulator with XRE-family HTH domain